MTAPTNDDPDAISGAAADEDAVDSQADGEYRRDATAAVEAAVHAAAAGRCATPSPTLTRRGDAVHRRPLPRRHRVVRRAAKHAAGPHRPARAPLPGVPGLPAAPRSARPRAAAGASRLARQVRRRDRRGVLRRAGRPPRRFDRGRRARPDEIRVVVDPYSRQAFLALENRIRGILSF